MVVTSWQQSGTDQLLPDLALASSPAVGSGPYSLVDQSRLVLRHPTFIAYPESPDMIVGFAPTQQAMTTASHFWHERPNLPPAIRVLGA